jgi:DUF1009 family protein
MHYIFYLLIHQFLSERDDHLSKALAYEGIYNVFPQGKFKKKPDYKQLNYTNEGIILIREYWDSP